MVVIFQQILFQQREQLLNLGLLKIFSQVEKSLGAVGSHLDDRMGEVLDDAASALSQVEEFADIASKETDSSGAVGSHLFFLASAVSHHVIQASSKVILTDGRSKYWHLCPV